MKPWMPPVFGVILLLAGFLAGRASVTPRVMVVETMPFKNHAATGLVAPTYDAPQPLTADDLNRYVATVCPKVKLQVYTTGSLALHSDMLRCIVSAALAAPNNREGRQESVTPQNPSLDPQTAQWYRLMTEKGYVPMTIMVPKGSR